MNNEEKKYVKQLEEQIENLEGELEDFHAFTDGANETEKQVRFIMVAHAKARNKSVFFDRLKELYLEGEIGQDSYEIAKRMYDPDIEPLGIQVESKPINKKQKPTIAPNPIINPCGITAAVNRC